MSQEQQSTALVGGVVPELGGIYFCPRYETICCRIRKEDHTVDGVGFRNAHTELQRMPGSIFIFLDQGRMEWSSDLEYGKMDMSVEGPLSQSEIDMQLMLFPSIDFTPWRKLYGKE